MELLEYFLSEVDKNNPYYQFKEWIENGQVNDFDNSGIHYEKFYVSSNKDAINKFRSLTQPGSTYTSADSYRFILICHYLYKHKYVIEEFSEFLENPTGLSEFAYGLVRSYLISLGEDENGTVTWQKRRDLINTLHFTVIENFYVQQDIAQLFQVISTRSAEFQMMSSEEKLKEIANLLEYLLKEGKKFKTLDVKNIYYDFISNEQIIGYRKLIQCFRHSSIESLAERTVLMHNSEFLISYGLAILAPLNKDN